MNGGPSDTSRDHIRRYNRATDERACESRLLRTREAPLVASDVASRRVQRIERRFPSWCAAKAPGSMTRTALSTSTDSRPLYELTRPRSPRHRRSDGEAGRRELGFFSPVGPTRTRKPSSFSPERLASSTPGDLNRVFFTSGGAAEANGECLEVSPSVSPACAATSTATR